jgi:hypothetical protein
MERQGWAQVKTTCVAVWLIEIVHSPEESIFAAEEKSHFSDLDSDDGTSTIRAR